ncbi:MAG: DUF4097 family beta strand repeat-containing protein [Gemmatimonadales bacterium]
MRHRPFASLMVIVTMLVLPSLRLGAQPRQLPVSLPLNPDGAVRIISLSDAGSIRVIGWDKDSIQVTGTIARTSSFHIGGTREGVKMFWETEKGTSTKLAGISDVVIRVPARARVSVNSAMADVEATAIAGQLDVTAVGSHIRVQGTPSELRAETMNGDIEVTASPAYLRLKTATGHVTWTGSSEDVALTTVSGKMVINGGTVNRARFESIDGDIRFSGGVTKFATVTFDTHGGDVTLLLAKDTDAEVQASGPSSDLFGKRSTPGADIAKRQTNYATAGKPVPSGASIVVRTFKGRVTASYQ